MPLLESIGSTIGRIYRAATSPRLSPMTPAQRLRQADLPVSATDLASWADRQVEKIRTASIGGRLHFGPYLDNYTKETPEIKLRYREMLREPTLKAALGTKVLAVAGLDVQAHPEEPDNPKHREQCEFLLWALRRLGGRQAGSGTYNLVGTRKIVWNVLATGLIDGWSLSELVWCGLPESRGKWRGKRGLADFKGKDTRFLSPLLDSYRNIIGVRGGSYNGNHTFEGEEFKDHVIWANWALFEAPTGMSDFRAPYRAFYIKDICWQLRGLHLEKYTGGMLKGTYTGADQKQELIYALERAKSSTWIAVPEGVLVEAMDLAMRGTADFESAIRDCDREMLIGTVGAYLQILEGQVSDGRGDTSIHRDTAELFQWQLAAVAGDVVTHQIAPRILEENFADPGEHTITWGSVSVAETAKQLDVYEKAQKVGIEISKRAAYQALGIQPPDDPEDTLTPPGGGPGGPGGGGGGLGDLLGGGGGGSGGGGPEGEPVEPFSDPSSSTWNYCQTGPNAGKPGPCPEGEGRGGSATARKVTGKAEKPLHLAGSDTARAAHQNMRALLSKMKKGDYHPEDVLSDLDDYTSKAATNAAAPFARAWSNIQARAEASHSSEALDSPEFLAVRTAAVRAGQRMKGKVGEMAEVVRANAEYYARPENAGQPITIGRDDLGLLDDLHNDMGLAHDQGTGELVQAVQAFLAKHPPLPGRQYSSTSARSYCQTGPNAGKPGPCPEGGAEGGSATSDEGDEEPYWKRDPRSESHLSYRLRINGDASQRPNIDYFHSPTRLLAESLVEGVLGGMAGGKIQYSFNPNGGYVWMYDADGDPLAVLTQDGDKIRVSNPHTDRAIRINPWGDRARMEARVRKVMKPPVDFAESRLYAHRGDGAAQGDGISTITSPHFRLDPRRWRTLARHEARLARSLGAYPAERRELERLREDAQGGYRLALGREVNDAERQQATQGYARACETLAERLEGHGKRKAALRARRLARSVQRHAGGDPARPKASARPYCQEGPNAGKPGPCPEGEDSGRSGGVHQGSSKTSTPVKHPPSVSAYVSGQSTPAEKAEVASLARQSRTSRPALIRIARDDRKHRRGEMLDFDEPVSFSGAVDAIKAGKPAGHIGWKSTDRALYSVEQPQRGLDVDYGQTSTSGLGFSAAGEKETILSGRYRVKEVRREVEPGTNPNYGYTVPHYILEEVGTPEEHSATGARARTFATQDNEDPQEKADAGIVGTNTGYAFKKGRKQDP